MRFKKPNVYSKFSKKAMETIERLKGLDRKDLIVSKEWEKFGMALASRRAGLESHKRKLAKQAEALIAKGEKPKIGDKIELKVIERDLCRLDLIELIAKNLPTGNLAVEAIASKIRNLDREIQAIEEGRK